MREETHQYLKGQNEKDMITRMDTERPTTEEKEKTTTEDRLLSTDEIKSILGKSRETVIDYIKKGKLKGSRIERQYHAWKSDVLAFVAQRAISTSMRDNTYSHTRDQAHTEDSNTLTLEEATDSNTSDDEGEA